MNDRSKPRRGECLGNKRHNEANDWSNMPKKNSTKTFGRGGSAKAKPIKDFTTQETRRGEELASAAYEWIHENERAFCAIAADIKRDARAGRRASPYRAVENMRAKEFTDAHGHTTRTPNALVPVLARIIVLDFPELRPFVHMSRSCVDAVELHSAVPLLSKEAAHVYL